MSAIEFPLQSEINIEQPLANYTHKYIYLLSFSTNMEVWYNKAEISINLHSIPPKTTLFTSQGSECNSLLPCGQLNQGQNRPFAFTILVCFFTQLSICYTP